jgi:hypothetical protein
MQLRPNQGAEFGLSLTFLDGTKVATASSTADLHFSHTSLTVPRNTGDQSSCLKWPRSPSQSALSYWWKVP